MALAAEPTTALEQPPADVPAGRAPYKPCGCAQMASFYDREYTDFERANFVTVWHCPAGRTVSVHATRHCGRLRGARASVCERFACVCTCVRVCARACACLRCVRTADASACLTGARACTHTDMCEEVRVPPNDKGWNRVSSDKN